MNSKEIKSFNKRKRSEFMEEQFDENNKSKGKKSPLNSPRWCKKTKKLIEEFDKDKNIQITLRKFLLSQENLYFDEKVFEKLFSKPFPFKYWVYFYFLDTDNWQFYDAFEDLDEAIDFAKEISPNVRFNLSNPNINEETKTNLSKLPMRYDVRNTPLLSDFLSKLKSYCIDLQKI